VFSTPTVAGDFLYLGSCAGVFSALDRDRGTVRWSQSVIADSVHREFHGDPLVTDDLVIIGTDTGPADSAGVWAFDRSTGEVRWRRRAGSGVTTDIVRHGARGFVVSIEGELLCLELGSGRVVWSVATGATDEDRRSRSPAVIGDRVYFSAADWTVRAFDPSTGRPLWTRRLSAGVTTGLATVRGQLAFCAADSHLYALDPKSGEVTARVPIAGGPYAGPLLAVGDSLLLALGERSITCFDWTRMRAGWSRSASRPWSSSRPYLWRGDVLAGTEDGELFAFRLVDGLPRWSHRVKGLIRGIGVGADTLYVGTFAGRVHALAVKR